MPSDTPPALSLAPLTEARARALAEWRYEGRYAVYDHPDWETMAAEGWGFTRPETRRGEFVALLDAREAVAGFLRFVPARGALDIGLGLRPDLCGRGLGATAMRLLEEEARRRGATLLRLGVRAFNERAIRCYERAGWRRRGEREETTALGPGTFVVMERRLAP